MTEDLESMIRSWAESLDYRDELIDQDSQMEPHPFEILFLSLRPKEKKKLFKSRDRHQSLEKNFRLIFHIRIFGTP